MLTLIRCPFHRALPQWHVKDPGHSAKNAGGKLHLKTHLPFIQRSRGRLSMPLSRHSVETYPETSSHNPSGNIRSSQLAEPLWTDPGIKSGMSVRELIATSKKKEQVGNE